MADWLISAMFAIGVGTWVYVKISKRSNNPSSSYTTAFFVGAIAFIVLFTFLKYILHA
jgi:ABC-type multidrug transport system permease subunit